MTEAADSDAKPPTGGDAQVHRRPWSPPTLTAHASLTALTQAQFSQGIPLDSTDGGPQRAVPCSQGFCP